MKKINLEIIISFYYSQWIHKTDKIICYFDLFIFLLLLEHCQREKIKKCLSLKKY